MFRAIRPIGDRTYEELEVNAAQQQKEIKALATIVKEQAAQIEKVSAQLEASRVALQVVGNPSYARSQSSSSRSPHPPELLGEVAEVLFSLSRGKTGDGFPLRTSYKQAGLW